MRKLLLLFCISPLFIASSCEDKEPMVEATGNIDLVVKANYDGTLFQTQNEYDYMPDMKVRFSEFNFYVSDISLLEYENSTEETELADIDFVELSYDITQTAQAEAGYEISTKQVPAGTYRALKIGFGVPADLNRTQPGDYGDASPLATSTHYWAGSSSYIFSKIEGFSDNDNSGAFEAGESFVFHLGQDQIYTERILFPSQPIVIGENQTVSLNLEVDLKKLFDMPLNQYDANSDDLLDLESFNSSHSNPDSPDFLIDKQLMRNFSDATTLKQ